MHNNSKQEIVNIHINIRNGYYVLKDNNIILDDNLIIKIQERKKESNKPKKYLAIYQKNKFICYLSSLYQISENIYIFDDRENKYLLEKKSDVMIEIKNLTI